MSDNQSETPRYVDPNSGAAPQPGGFAAPGPVAQEPKSDSPAGGDGAAPADAKAEPKAEAKAEPKAETKSKARKD